VKTERLRLARVFAACLAVCLTGCLASSPVLADKPAHAGAKGKGAGHSQKADRHEGGKHAAAGGIDVSLHFGDDERRAVREYFESSMRGGNCPPGLAKKNNGCMPPGQAKKWARGRVLPPDVVVYPVPPELEVRIRVPTGHKLVRVAEDILMIAVGTNMVVDAIEDLGRL
jgi:hypothetical protein